MDLFDKFSWLLNTLFLYMDLWCTKLHHLIKKTKNILFQNKGGIFHSQ